MTHEATVTYSREIIRKGVGHFWRRFIAWHGFLAIALCILGCVALLLSGDRSWRVGALGAFGMMLGSLAASVYVVYLRRSLWKFDRMTSKTVRFTFTEERWSAVSDIGSSDLSWQAVERVWRFPEVWLLFVAKTTYVTLPIAELDQPTRDFIAEQVARHGGRVV